MQYNLFKIQVILLSALESEGFVKSQDLAHATHDESVKVRVFPLNSFTNC